MDFSRDKVKLNRDGLAVFFLLELVLLVGPLRYCWSLEPFRCGSVLEGILRLNFQAGMLLLYLTVVAYLGGIVTQKIIERVKARII